MHNNNVTLPVEASVPTGAAPLVKMDRGPVRGLRIVRVEIETVRLRIGYA
jgi:hypothetical protein